MPLRKEPSRGLRGLKNLSKRIEEIEEAENINITQIIPDLKANRINGGVLFIQDEWKTESSDVNSEVKKNIDEPIYSGIAKVDKTRHEENSEPALKPVVEKNHNQDIFGSPLYCEGDFCVEAINTCQEIVLFKICLNRKVLLPEKPIQVGNSIALPKEQSLIIKELRDTEETYLKKMNYAIKNYLQYFRDHEISPDLEKIFGNIEEVYCETEKIYCCMKRSISVDDIAIVFLNNVSVFECYNKYLRNQMKIQQHPIEECIDLIKQRQIELQDIHTCESYLAHPAQRPGRYKLLLENLQRVLTKTGDSSKLLQEAITLLDTKMSEANTLMAIDSIQHCPFNLYNAGRFLMKDTFTIRGKYQSVIFLFEKYVAFCKGIQNNPNLYDYIDSIDMDKLILTHTNSSMRFQLGRYRKSQTFDDEGRCEFDIESPLMVIKTKWVDEITRILWTQLQYYKDQSKNSNPMEGPINKLQLSEEPDSETETNSEEEDALKSEKTALYDEDFITGRTFFDKDKIPRIEVLRSSSLESKNPYVEGIPESIITELIQTEEAYLEEIKYIIDGKINFGSTDSKLLENIENIFIVTEIFHLKLLECNSVDSVAKVFLNNAYIFDFYTEYMRNKAMCYREANSKIQSQNLPAQDKEIEKKSQYVIDSYLLNPVLTRPGKYKALLEKLQREHMKVGLFCTSLDEAVKLVNNKIIEANTLMAADSIQDCPLNLAKLGPFIKKALFKLKRKNKSAVFLFKGVILICTEDKTRPDTYIYVDSIEMANLTVTNNRNSLSFELIDSQKSKLSKERKCTFTLEAPTKSMKEKWINEIQNLLWKQIHSHNSFIGP